MTAKKIPAKAIKSPATPVKAAAKGKVAASPAKKIGRPKGSGSTYTDEIASTICGLVLNGVPLRQVCRMPGMPAWRTVYDWCDDHPLFSARLAQARDLGFDALAEEALEIADTPVMGHKQVMGDDKTTTTVEDMLGHRKLQIETRLKLLACWNPKKYGNKVALGGDAGNPIQIEASTEAQGLLDALLKHAELTKQAAASE